MFDNNRNQNQVNTNTTLLTWYSGESKLTISAWNEKLSLKFNKATSKTPEGMNIFDREQEITTALTCEKVQVLYELCKKEIIPSETETSITISLGSAEAPNALTVKKKIEDGKPLVTLTFIKGLNPDGKAGDASKIVEYAFQNVEYMKDYDYTTGTGTEETLPGQFQAFIAILANFIHTLPFAYHGKKHSENIAKKYSSNYNNNGGNFNSGSSDTFGGFAGVEELPFS